MISELLPYLDTSIRNCQSRQFPFKDHVIRHLQTCAFFQICWNSDFWVVVICVVSIPPHRGWVTCRSVVVTTEKIQYHICLWMIWDPGVIEGFLRLAFGVCRCLAPSLSRSLFLFPFFFFSSLFLISFLKKKLKKRKQKKKKRTSARNCYLSLLLLSLPLFASLSA